MIRKCLNHQLIHQRRNLQRKSQNKRSHHHKKSSQLLQSLKKIHLLNLNQRKNNLQLLNLNLLHHLQHQKSNHLLQLQRSSHLHLHRLSLSKSHQSLQSLRSNKNASQTTMLLSRNLKLPGWKTKC
jgi:hypothetical protein